MLTNDQWNELIVLQNSLDKRILQEKGLLEIETINHRFLALLVELSEFTNEERSFKYWSSKPGSQKDKLLSEYVDCLHFIISLSISLKIDLSKYEFNNIFDEDLIQLIINTFNQILISQKKSEQKDFYLLCDYFLSIANKLNFTNDDIYETYILKNKINHERQDNNY